MVEFNSYPIFVADQVLMADHLNEIVNYLDEQDRLTRNKLIGIGIVCGLELKVSSSQIKITKGCGVTSAGYLIVQDEVTLSYYKPYELPSDFFPKYKSIYEPWNMWELITAEQSLEEDEFESIEGNAAFMRDKIVVLLLEMKETPLKNCVDTDCDDKGDKIAFAIKPLLVSKSDIDKFLKKNPANNFPLEPNPAIDSNIEEIQLQRFNVPVNQLSSADAVLNSFLEIVNEPLLKRLSEALNYCYNNYKPILFEEPVNPFSNVFELLKNRLSFSKNSNPFFIQYYYDWVDDIIKAYNEFKEKVFDVQVMCCPDDDLFPLHLMLGEATKSTSIDTKTGYRHYFLYSPLFNQQKELLSEVQLLFRRIKLVLQNYVIPNPNTFNNAAIKITPSKYLDKPLSDRCIPYYYNPSNLFQAWSWDKTRRGKAKNNLSYNANQYNSSEPIVKPLLYDIERFNFFRVEGHIGKNYTQALSSIIGQRNQYNLPFEVVALSTATVNRFMSTQDKECLFKDLESLYQVIIAELICKFGDLACKISNINYQPNFSGSNFITPLELDTLVIENPNFRFNNASLLNSLLENPSISINTNALSSMLGQANISAINIPKYKKGDFLRKHCSIQKGTLGETYLALINKGHSFVKPAITDNFNINTIYTHFFYFLDCVENVMGASWPYSLKNYTSRVFNSRFKALSEEVLFIANNQNRILEIAKDLRLEEILKRFPALTHTCFDERLEALKNEYLKRLKEVQALVNFMNYFKSHPGMEHKAGVPKGGTFILVYHETPPRPQRRTRSNVFTEFSGAVMERANFIPENILSNLHIEELMKEASVKDPVLLKNFHLALNKYLDICDDMDDNTKDEITDILVNFPPILVPSRFRIPEFAVIADFYLPYLCCSDCAPIAFVLPKTPEAVLSISMTPTEFCNDDEGTYNVIVSPEGGALSATSGGIDPTTNTFKPKGLNAGINTLKYSLPDGRSTSVDVKITSALSIDFTFEVLEDDITVQFFPAIDQSEEVTWDFGDGSKSNELEPSHTYQFEEEEREFVVGLGVKNGPCYSKVEHTIRLQRPQRSEFDITPKIFCSNDERPYSFITSPAPESIDDIKNENELKIKLESNEVSFTPVEQNLSETKDFQLSFQGNDITIRIVVPNADFIMKLTDNPNPTHGFITVVLHLEAKNSNADQYQWTIQQGNRPLSFSEKAVDVSYRASRLNLEQDLRITLITRNNIPEVNCEDTKSFILTREILSIFMNKDAFDNNTNLNQ